MTTNILTKIADAALMPVVQTGISDIAKKKKNYTHVDLDSVVNYLPGRMTSDPIFTKSEAATRRSSPGSGF